MVNSEGQRGFMAFDKSVVKGDVHCRRLQRARRYQNPKGDIGFLNGQMDSLERKSSDKTQKRFVKFCI